LLAEVNVKAPLPPAKAVMSNTVLLLLEPPTVTVKAPEETDLLVAYKTPPAPPAEPAPFPPPPTARTSTERVSKLVNVPLEVNVWYLYPPETTIVPPVGKVTTLFLPNPLAPPNDPILGI
jgi:hypothetical protein